MLGWWLLGFLDLDVGDDWKAEGEKSVDWESENHLIFIGDIYLLLSGFFMALIIFPHTFILFHKQKISKSILCFNSFEEIIALH